LQVLEQTAEGFVLAGGQSSRMGQDKALVRLGNEPLIARAIAILRNVDLQVSISGSPSTLSSFAPVIEDGPQGSRGPLSGICAALAATRSKYSVFLPVDLPLIPTSLIVFMLNLARATDSFVTLPTVNGFTQTFPAVIDRAVLPSLKRQLAGKDSGCFRSFQFAAEDFNQHLRLFHVEHLIQTGQLTHPDGLPPSLWFQNINTPDDLAYAEKLQFGRHRVI
jgi:molybdopterin-guanine dinucleotide biosynthesis protein A